MTNKEAAFILSDDCYDYSTEELRTAFDLAIKALEECAKNAQGDLISRSALKEEFAKHEDRKGYLIGDWEDIIDNAPTVERPTGEWIFIDNDIGWDKCSNCDWTDARCHSWNFCPNCGALMIDDGGQATKI